MKKKKQRNLIRLLPDKDGALILAVEQRVENVERIMQLRKKVSGIIDILETDSEAAFKRSPLIFGRVKSIKKVGE